MAEEKQKPKKTYSFIAKVAVKGDFDAEDGLGVAAQEIAAGQRASTDDKALYDLLVDEGHVKPASKKGANEDEDEEVAASKSKPPPVKADPKT